VPIQVRGQGLARPHRRPPPPQEAAPNPSGVLLRQRRAHGLLISPAPGVREFHQPDVDVRRVASRPAIPLPGGPSRHRECPSPGFLRRAPPLRLSFHIAGSGLRRVQPRHEAVGGRAGQMYSGI